MIMFVFGPLKQQFYLRKNFTFVQAWMSSNDTLDARDFINATKTAKQTTSIC
jgi:hypothetical protein